MGDALKRAPLQRTRSLRRARRTYSPLESPLAGRFFTDVTMPEENGRRRRAPCVMCGRGDGRTIYDSHHVLSKRFLRSVASTLSVDPNDLLWDVRNGICLCRACHDAHETSAERVMRGRLPVCVFEFAEYVNQMLGTQAASVEIERRYP